MTDERWQQCHDPVMMLGMLGGRRSNRKLVLFGVACCRASSSAEAKLQAPLLNAAECYVDSEGSVDEIHVARRKYDSDACPAQRLAKIFEISTDAQPLPILARIAEVAEAASSLGVEAARQSRTQRKAKIDQRFHTQSQLLRDVFGNPFRPASIEASWLTSDVVLLARGIYDDRAFDRMPILADALQDAGCDDEDVLNHCRDADTTHVRGCWVVDLLLGRA